MTDPVMLRTVSIGQLADALRSAGYRAQPATDASRWPVIQSAAQGLGFIVCPGNAAPGAEERYVDFSFNCLIRVEGTLQVPAIESWNATKRFARLYRDRELLILTLDVMVAGGVSADSLLAYCELWDRVLHDFITHLKTARMVVASDPGLPEPAHTE